MSFINVNESYKVKRLKSTDTALNTALNRIFTVYFHSEIKANLFGYNN